MINEIVDRYTHRIEDLAENIRYSLRCGRLNDADIFAEDLKGLAQGVVIEIEKQKLSMEHLTELDRLAALAEERGCTNNDRHEEDE